jgi:hypothetical protein
MQVCYFHLQRNLYTTCLLRYSYLYWRNKLWHIRHSIHLANNFIAEEIFVKVITKTKLEAICISMSLFIE